MLEKTPEIAMDNKENKYKYKFMCPLRDLTLDTNDQDEIIIYNVNALYKHIIILQSL